MEDHVSLLCRRCAVLQENPETSRCLGVFGLSLYTEERDLRQVFEHYGPVDEVQVVYDHQSGRSRGFAFVYMRNHHDAVEVSSRRHLPLCIDRVTWLELMPGYNITYSPAS